MVAERNVALKREAHVSEDLREHTVCVTLPAAMSCSDPPPSRSPRHIIQTVRVAPNRRVTIDTGWLAVDPNVARELIRRPSRSLSLEEAGYVLLYLEERGAIDFVRNRVDYGRAGEGVVLPRLARVTIRRVVAGVEYRNISENPEPQRLERYALPNLTSTGLIDNCDVRMAVLLYKLACFLRTQHHALVITHQGIGHGNGPADDCHNQGRALDFAGVIGDTAGGTGITGTPPAWSPTAYLRSVRFDWHMARIADSSLAPGTPPAATSPRPTYEWPTWENGAFVAVRDARGAAQGQLALDAFRSAHPSLGHWRPYRATTYRLPTTPTPLTTASPAPAGFFRDVYDFLAGECSDRGGAHLYDDARTSATTLGDGTQANPCTSAMMIHPDYPTSAHDHDPAWLRQTHYNHIHAQIGPTRPAQTRLPVPTTRGRLPLVRHIPEPPPGSAVV